MPVARQIRSNVILLRSSAANAECFTLGDHVIAILRIAKDTSIPVKYDI
jgi:hypothetical protein